MRKHLLASAALLAVLGALVWADEVDPVLAHDPVERTTAVGDSPAEENVLAQHDVDGPEYRADCLSCHSDVLTQQSQDPRILAFHQAMMPYTPGYNPAHGPDDAVCVQCHRFVEIREDSAGALHKHVDPQMCALCHGPSGPGPVYYER